MARDPWSGLTEVSMRVSGRITEPVVRVSSPIKMGTLMRGSGTMIRRMGWGCIVIRMELSMMGSGSMICRREREVKFGLMGLGMRVVIRRGRSLGLECILGEITQSIGESGWRIR